MFCPIADLDFGLQKTGTRCAALCSSSTTCKGFFYHKQDKICKGAQDMIFNSDGCQIMAGTSFYQNTAVTTTTSTTPTTTTTSITTAATISGQYGNICASESDCTMAYSKCLDGLCSCVAGYRYQSSTGLCVADCGNYGSTYIEYRVMRLTANTIIQADENKSLTFCQDACAAEPTCRGFNFGYPTNRCVLEYGTPLTHPSAFNAKTDFSYFSRNCE
ncbi:uncharacterized protein LOC132733500 [Ruditapes philippinarum]|uniref:uncharacterized protein LOC132733500 n=1 Tax=Ruditapes philippinarum TaxID=129788 RepID=UPI00295ABCC0|nr:uncharacterized protein LOC132733500 [Ruditapes philippinarum]